MAIVYIVDDDEGVRTALARLLHSAGLESRPFNSPEAFLAEIKLESPACILLDITMPKISGLQVQERLIEKGIEFPVIAVSARDNDETRRSARFLGAKFFLRKPVDDQALLDTIAWVTASDCWDTSKSGGVYVAPGGAQRKFGL
jgi:FixJ family two-component response regulator